MVTNDSIPLCFIRLGMLKTFTAVTTQFDLKHLFKDIFVLLQGTISGPYNFTLT